MSVQACAFISWVFLRLSCSTPTPPWSTSMHSSSSIYLLIFKFLLWLKDENNPIENKIHSFFSQTHKSQPCPPTSRSFWQNTPNPIECNLPPLINRASCLLTAQPILDHRCNRYKGVGAFTLQYIEILLMIL